MKHTTRIIGAAALVVLLLAAAFVGVQWLNTEAAAGANPLPMMAEQSGGQPGSPAQEVQTAFDMDIEAAGEIPQTEPEVAGLLTRRGDKSIHLATGNISMVIGMNPDGSHSIKGSADGPEVEVVIPHTAQIYVDTTALTALDASQLDGSRKQTVEPGSVDDINENGIISVWGERRGDRIIAETVLYMADALSTIPNPR